MKFGSESCISDFNGKRNSSFDMMESDHLNQVYEDEVINFLFETLIT